MTLGGRPSGPGRLESFIRSISLTMSAKLNGTVERCRQAGWSDATVDGEAKLIVVVGGL